ncbi:MAG: hypothetical protein K8S55_08215 [Phycisphaerae bacterium]|nr:hypothetical protein [Phycisphaerae bacterium]
MRKSFIIISCVLTILVGSVASLQAAGIGETQAKYLCISKTAHPPVIDGKLGKDEWAGCAKIPGFVLKSGICPPTQQTEVFITYDDKTFYFAARCLESSMDKIRTRVKEHNGAVYNDDNIELFIDTNYDRYSYRQFVLNSIAVQWSDELSKKGTWPAAAQRHADRWVVEMAIPFAQLGITPEKGFVCGLNICRIRWGKKPELSCWSPTYGGFHSPGRFGCMVFGSFKDVAVREADKLRAQLDKITAKDSGNAAMLVEIKKLEESVKPDEKFDVDRFRSLRKSAEAIGEKIVDLGLSDLRAKLTGAGTVETQHLTSAASRGNYKFPENWRSRKILGQYDFLHDLSNHKMPLFKKAGLADEPFIKDALMGVYVLHNKMFKKKFFDPKSPIRKELKKTGRPFCINALVGNARISDIPPSLCRRFIKEYGDQFVGFIADECFGHDADKKWRHLGVSKPKNRKDAFMVFVACALDRHTRIFRNWALSHNEFRNWAICTISDPLDHLALETHNLVMSGHEIGGYMMSTPFAFACSRGAARQYDKPWRTYLAVWGPGVVWGSVTGYQFLSPRCRRAFARPTWDTGPYCGTSLSLQKRQIFGAYMSGTNIFRDESDADVGSIYVANYDHRKIHEVDDLVIVLRDRPYALSPAGSIRQELHDNLVKKHDRGATYTPVALIFDRYHGYMNTENISYILGMIPYAEADYMMRAVNDTLFPWERRMGERKTMVTGPFGDMFDILTNNAPGEVIDTYKAAMLVGDVALDGQFVSKLIKYVRNGGTLIINAKQIKGKLPEKFQEMLGCKVTEKRGRGKIAFSNLDNSVIPEKKPFNFQYLQPTTATTLVSLVEGDKKTAPLVLSNKYGKGRVIVTAPDYLKETGSKTRMLKLFSHLMRNLNSELLPVAVEGNVEYIVNRNKNGWVVTLINNEGAYKYPGKKEVIKSKENVDAKITLKRNALVEVSKVSEWLTGKELKLAKTPQGTKVILTVPAGDVRIIEFAQ